jgi:hypothetical protein
MKFPLFLLTLLLPLFSMTQTSYWEELPSGTLHLTEAGASHFAGLALDCMQREYPNKLNQMLRDSSMLQSPKALHPAFYGCFDWHSSVHGHWMLVRLLKEFPDLPEAEEIRKKLDENINAITIQGEVDYFIQSSKSWERMYGWSWLMKLAEELHQWEDEQGQQLYLHLRPLVEVIQKRYMEFLPVQNYPVRTGVHPNTAFGLSFAWDYAQAAGQEELKKLIESRARYYYADDRDCPADWEPSGEDFLSACLEEANLMSRVMEPAEFQIWLADFLPKDKLRSLLQPADVSDRSDPKIVHLDGVNLSRAWCFYRIKDGVQDLAVQQELLTAAKAHLQATIPNIASEHYEGTHWLASFAVYALSSAAK